MQRPFFRRRRPFVLPPLRSPVAAPAIVAAAVVAATGPIALGRSATEDPRVDQGVADVSPLSSSLRNDLLADLRGPLGFTDVRRLEDGRFARSSGALQAVFPRSIYVGTRAGTMPLLPPDLVYVVGEAPTAALVGSPGGASFFGPTAGPMLVSDLRGADRLETVRPSALRAPGFRPLDALTPGARGLAASSARATEAPLPPTAAPPPPERVPDADARLASPTTLPAIARDPAYRARRVHELLRRALAATD